MQYRVNYLKYLRYILGMNTIDGVTHILPGSDQEGEGQAGHHRDGVVQAEDAGVDLDVGELHQTLQTPQKIQHG